MGEPVIDYRDPEWVAERLGIDKNTVYKHLAAGLLPGVRLGRKWLISERRLAEFLDSRTEEQTRLRQVVARATPRAAAALDDAVETARRASRAYVGQEHLVLGIARGPDSLGAKMLVDLGVDIAVLRSRLEESLSTQTGAGAAGDQPEWGDDVVAVLLAARAEADRLSHSWLGVEHFVLGLLGAPSGFGHDLLVRYGITLEAARDSCNRLIAPHVAADRAAALAALDRSDTKTTRPKP